MPVELRKCFAIVLNLITMLAQISMQDYLLQNAVMVNVRTLRVKIVMFAQQTVEPVPWRRGSSPLLE